MAYRPDNGFERDITDIIPERFDADADSREARSAYRWRNYLAVAMGVAAVGVIVAVGLKFVGTRHPLTTGTPMIRADERPIKIRPDDRGGLQVPNQDKLVYDRMDSDAKDKSAEQLLSPPETPAPPVKTATAPMITPPPVKTVAKPVAAPPPVVAPVPTPVAAPTPAPVPAPVPALSSSGGDWVVQLGSVRSSEDADREWARIRKSNADLLGTLTPDILRVDLGDKGVFWRIRGGTMPEDAARQLCQSLAEHKQGCLVVHK